MREENENVTENVGWTPITRSSGRKLAEERAARASYREEYRRKLILENTAETVSPTNTAVNVDNASDEEKEAKRRAAAELEEERKREAENRYTRATERLRNLVGEGADTSSDRLGISDDSETVSSDTFTTSNAENPQNAQEISTDSAENAENTEQIHTSAQAEPATANDGTESIVIRVGGESDNENVIRTEGRTYTVGHSGGVRYVPLMTSVHNLNLLYAEYNRICEICRSNEAYYNSRIAELEAEHRRNLALLTDASARAAENERYENAVTATAVAHGEAMGGLITRQRELGEDIARAEAALQEPLQPSFSSNGYDYAEPVSEAVADPVTDAEPLGEVDYSVRDGEAIDYRGNTQYTDGVTDVTEPTAEIDYLASGSDQSISYPDEAGYPDGHTDVTDPATDVDYSPSADERSISYPAEADTLSQTDGTGAVTEYRPDAVSDGAEYEYRYDPVTDTSGYDHDVAMSGSAGENPHIDYTDENYVFEPVRPSDYDRRMIEDEHIRFLRDTERRDRNIREGNAPANEGADGTRAENPVEKCRTCAENAAALVGARITYEVSVGERELAYKKLEFSVYDRKEEKKRKIKARNVSRMRRAKKKAQKLEKAATMRYYTTLLLGENRRRKNKNPEKLDSVISRLQVALAEREEIDRRLTDLYKGAETKTVEKILQKAEKKRYKVAKAVCRSLRKTNRHLEKLHAPLDLKKKIKDLFNKKVEAHSTIAYSKYLLKKQKPKGERKKELKKDISKAKSTLRYVKRDIRHFMKKAEKHDDKHKSDIIWAIWLICTLIVLVGIGVLWYFFGESIMSFFASNKS